MEVDGAEEGAKDKALRNCIERGTGEEDPALYMALEEVI